MRKPYLDLEAHKSDMRIEKFKLDQLKAKRYDLLLKLKVTNQQVETLEIKLKQMAELPAKIEASNLNIWRGLCPSCKINLDSNDMPFSDSCPYCNNEIPYKRVGIQ